MATRIQKNQEKKVISNEEYVIAYNDTQNKKIMRAASKSFRGLSPETKKSCCMNALWLTLIHHRDGFGQKFTTNLYKFVVWECSKELTKHNRIISRECQMLDEDVGLSVSYDDVPVYMQDCIQQLSPKLATVIKQKFFDNMTLAEIGRANGYSKQMANVNLNKGLEKLRLIMKNCV